MANKNGFTLLELSMVLIILSLIAGSSLLIVANKSEANRVQETTQKMEFIEKSLANYLAEYGAIPCPADPGAAPSAASFGVAMRIAGALCNGSNALSHWYFNGAFNALDLGTVPTKELQIPDDYAYDAWGRRFTYVMIEQCNGSNIQYLPGYVNGGQSAVNPAYVVSPNFSIITSCGGVLGSSNLRGLTIKNSAGTVTTYNAIYVLMSHGKNGHGAYPHNGGTAWNNRVIGINSIGADEITNALYLSNGSNYQLATGIYVQKPINYASDSTYFDDIVHFRTKDQIIKEAQAFDTNGLTYSFPSGFICGMAKNVITSGVANICPTNNTLCTTNLNLFAYQINSLCF
jgi:prepilin-type N-terminal cleavage/methylation domain-containing protein